MSQEDRPEAQTAASTTVEEWTSPARPWDTSKRVAPVLMRVLLTNKSEADDVKVWYRLNTKNAAGANVVLPLSSRKAYISAKSQTVIENLIKIDPTKDYFFENMADVEVELEATVKDQEEVTNTRNNQKRVHYQPQHDTLGVGSSVQEDDDDERDDDEAYHDYQENPHHTGYDGNEHQAEGEALGRLLHLRPQAGADGADADRQSNGSTDAVRGNAGDGEDGHSQDEGLDGDDPAGQPTDWP